MEEKKKKNWGVMLKIIILFVVISIPNLVKADMGNAIIKVTGNYNKKEEVVSLKVSGKSTWYPDNEVYYDLIIKYDNNLLKLDDENVSIKILDNGMATLHILANGDSNGNYKAEEEIKFKTINKEKSNAIISISSNIADSETLKDDCNNFCKEESSKSKNECIDSCLYVAVENMAVSSMTIEGDSKYTVTLEKTSSNTNEKEDISTNIENGKEENDYEIINTTKKYDKTNLIMYVSLGINVLLLIIILLKLPKNKNQ